MFRSIYNYLHYLYLRYQFKEIRVVNDPRYPGMLFFAGNSESYIDIAMEGDPDLRFRFFEIITRAAIKHPSGIIFSVERPGRHHHVISAMASVDCADTIGQINTMNQGFITSHGHFVDRVVGLEIATEAHQIKFKHNSIHELYTEDMWDNVDQQPISY